MIAVQSSPDITVNTWSRIEQVGRRVGTGGLAIHCMPARRVRGTLRRANSQIRLPLWKGRYRDQYRRNDSSTLAPVNFSATLVKTYLGIIFDIKLSMFGK